MNPTESAIQELMQRVADTLNDFHQYREDPDMFFTLYDKATDAKDAIRILKRALFHDQEMYSLVQQAQLSLSNNIFFITTQARLANPYLRSEQSLVSALMKHYNRQEK